MGRKANGTATHCAIASDERRNSEERYRDRRHRAHRARSRRDPSSKRRKQGALSLGERESLFAAPSWELPRGGRCDPPWEFGACTESQRLRRIPSTSRAICGVLLVPEE